MTLPEQLHFIRPLWLLALPLAVLLPWAFAHVRRPSGDWERVCDPHLLRWLSVRHGGTGSRSGTWLAGAGLAIAVLALSGPSWQKLPDNVDYDNGFKEQWEMFIRHVCEDAPYKYTLLEGAKGVQLAECALQSWKERRWIDVAPIRA